MKLSKLSNLILVGLLLAVPAVGCKKKPTSLTPLPGARAGQVPEPGAAPAIPGEKPGESAFATGIKSNEPGSHQGWLEDANMLKADTVHFDFDSSVVKTGEKPKVAKVAAYLNRSSANADRVDVKCDERGTEEYKLSPGKRRERTTREER